MAESRVPTQAQQDARKAQPQPTGDAHPQLATPTAPMMAQRMVANPQQLAHHEVLYLQRTIGNRATAQLLAATHARPPQAPTLIQSKLTVGPAQDRYEDEADAIAGQVMRKISAPASPALQRTPAPKFAQSAAHVKLTTPRISRVRGPAAHARLQPKGDAPVVGQEGGAVGGDLESSIRRAKGGGLALPDKVRGKMEQGFGSDFKNVRIHTNDRSDQLNRSLGAKAFTTGSDIFFQRNTFNPHSADGTKLLAHELTHVVQQGAAPPQVRRHPDTAAQAAPPIHPSQTGEVVQRKTDKQEAKRLRDQFNYYKQDVVWKMRDENWVQALSGIKTYGYEYKKSGWWGRTQLGKWARGISKLNPIRIRAKGLLAKRNTRKPTEVVEDIKKAAKDAADFKGSNFADSDIGYAFEMLQKIGYYLAAAIPNSVRALYDQYLDFTPDLSGILPPTGVGGDDTVEKSEQVKQDETTLKHELTSGGLSNRGFHGSASWLLEGLKKSGGKLLSQKSAFEAGLLRTGEGTTFSSGDSLKTNVYIGKGEMGFATAAAYALAPGVLSSYNVSLFSDEELDDMISTYVDILQHDEVLDQMESTVRSGLKTAVESTLVKSSKSIGIDPDKDSGYSRVRTLQKKLQLEEMLSKLRKEKQARTSWDSQDERRKGGRINPDNYPILLDFDLTGLTASDDPMWKSRVKQGNYALAGEATVADEIDLNNGRLKAVYCPEQFIEKTKQKLKEVFGDKNGIAVRALESISGSVERSTEGGKTLDATYGQLEKQQKTLDVKISTQGQLSKQMLDYLDKNEKDKLHGSITKSMIGDVPVVKETETPEALLMMGGPGSGKSTIIESILDPSERANLVVADADAIKERLPQYRAGVKRGDKDAAQKAHPISKQIVGTLLNEVITTRRNLLYDATGANYREYNKLIQQLKTAGYKVTLVMTHITVEEGVSRVKSRAEKTGRSVPERIVRSVYTSAPKNFRTLAPTVDDALVFDNMGSDRSPKLVWSKSMDVRKLYEVLGLG